MRVIGNIPHQRFKITLFEWNGKFIIKFESGPYEQVYKIDQTEIQESQLSSLMDTTFIEGVTRRFNEMHMDTINGVDRLF